MVLWKSIIGVIGVSLFTAFAVPNIIIPLYDKITGGNYKVVEQYMPIIRSCSAKYGVDPIFVAAVLYYESGGNPEAVSPQNAIGLMQLMPTTAKSECNIYNPSQLFVPDINIECGTKYIATLLYRYARGDYRSAAAMYIGGPKFNPFAVDAHNTTPLQYADRIMQHYQKISEKISG